MMSGIRGKDTKPELIVRRGLHAMGFRYRLHDKRLPGKPDLVFANYRTAIFVHGCFWHGHNCSDFKWPKTRPDFWRQKIDGNRARDKRATEELNCLGWRVGVVWECSTKKRIRIDLITDIADWIVSDHPENAAFGDPRYV